MGLRCCARAFCSCGELRCAGLVAPRHVGSSRTRAWTSVPCIGRQVPNHCTTREVPEALVFLHSLAVVLKCVECARYQFYVNPSNAMSWWLESVCAHRTYTFSFLIKSHHGIFGDLQGTFYDLIRFLFNHRKEKHIMFPDSVFTWTWEYFPLWSRIRVCFQPRSQPAYIILIFVAQGTRQN